MQSDTSPPTPSYPLSDLCVLADLSPRTVRYYVQIGLVDRPEGETRAARYGATHLEQLLLIKKWTAAGLSLERIRELLQGEQAVGAHRRVRLRAIFAASAVPGVLGRVDELHGVVSRLSQRCCGHGPGR